MRLVELRQGYLYHTTPLRFVYQILKNDNLLASRQSNGTRAVSLSRDPRFVRMYLDTGNYVRIKLDMYSLSKRYKIIPYSENERGKDTQYEEHINTDIVNLHNYIIGIDVILNTDIQESELDSIDILRSKGFIK